MSTREPDRVTGKARQRDPNLARYLMSGASWALGGKIIGLGSMLVVNALLARMLPAAEFGAYFVAVSITTFAAIVARFGLRQTVVRLVAESMAKGLPGRAGRALRIVYLITVLGSALVAGGYYLGVGAWLSNDVFEMPSLAGVVGVTAVWIAILTFQTPVAETFRGLHEFRLAVLLDGILASALLAIALGAVWLLGREIGLHTAVLLTVATAGASLLIGTGFFLGRIGELKGPGTIEAKEVVSISAPLFVTNLATQAMTSASLWIVAGFLAAEAVALYGAAWKLVNLVAVPLELMNKSVQPVIAELHAADDRRKLQDSLRGTATVAGLPAAIGLFAMLFFGAELLDLVYGAPYREAALILAIMAFGQLANVWTGSCGTVLVFTGHQRALMNMSLVTSALTVVATVVAVQRWGLVGAATATAAGRVLQNGVAWLLVRRLTGYWTHGTLNPRFIMRAARRALAGRTR